MTASPNDDRSDGVGPAVFGSVAIAFLLLTALLAGAIPYTLSLVGLAQLPFPFGLQELPTRDLVISSVLIFLMYAFSEIPADLAGKVVTIGLSLRDAPERRERLRTRRNLQGRLVSQLLQAVLITLLLTVWVTNSLWGALLAAFLTATLEFFLDPLLARYSKRKT